VSTIDRERVQAILARIEHVNVAIFGDLMLDRYVWGDVSRISPEAPVPVVEITQETVRFGGAANVAENVASLGASASLVGVVGDDRTGAELLSLLGERAVETGGVVTVPGRPTTTKTRIIAHSQQLVRADREEVGDVPSSWRESVLRELASAIERADVLVISDYGKGVVTKESLSAAISAGRASGKIICVDPKESHFQSYVGVTVITPNQKEAGAAVGVRITDDDSLKHVGWELRRMLEAECVLVTLGEQGMALFMRDRELIRLPTVAREVFDVTGAGDTVVSVLAAALAAGATMEEAATISNHAAGIVIREVGTASVSREELVRSFEASDGGAAGG
jgi:rfaE bifunctional protein kinase chain/domain